MSNWNLKFKIQHHNINTKNIEIPVCKYVQDVYKENYKTLIKEIKEDERK